MMDDARRGVETGMGDLSRLTSALQLNLVLRVGQLRL